MAKVGIKRFGAGDGKENRAQGDEPDHPVGRQKTHPIDRAKGKEHLGIAGNRDDAGNGDGDEPHDGDRAEERSTLAVPLIARQTERPESRP